MPRISRSQANARAVVQPQSAALRLALRHLQSFAPPNPLHPFMADRPARCLQECRHPAVAVAPVLFGQRDDVVRQRLFVICPTRHFALHRQSGPNARHFRRSDTSQHLPHMVDAPSAACGAKKFSRAASCRSACPASGPRSHVSAAGSPSPVSSFAATIRLQAAIFLAPSIVGLLANRDAPSRFGGRAALAQHDLHFAQLANDFLGLVLLRRHS